MSGIIEFVIGYIILLVFWLITNMFFYALSVVTRKSFFYIPFAINTILNWIIQIYFFIYPFYFLWQVITANSGSWILVILALLVGLFFLSFLLYFWQMIIGLLMYPISMITVFFSQKAAEVLDKKGEEFAYEVISPKGEVIGKYQSWDKTQKQLAKWFVVSFVIAVINQFMKSNYGEGVGFGWYLIIPMFVLLLSTIVIGFFVGIYNLIRKRGFFGHDKYLFLTKTLKIYAIIYGISILFDFLLG